MPRIDSKSRFLAKVELKSNQNRNNYIVTTLHFISIKHSSGEDCSRFFSVSIFIATSVIS